MSRTTAVDSVLRTRALNTHRLFAALMPFIPRAERLALNAEVAACRLGSEGLPYSAVVRELSVMADELSGEIDGVTAAFRGFARTIAAWSQADLRAAIYTRALQRMRELGRVQSSNVRKALSLEDRALRIEALFDAVGDDHRDDGVSRMVTCWMDEESRAVLELSNLESDAGGIVQSVECIQQAATRRSRFIAITAMVESAKVTTGGSVLNQVSSEIRKLSEELGEAGTMARSAITEVMDATCERLNPLLGALQKVRLMEVAQ